MCIHFCCLPRGFLTRLVLPALPAAINGKILELKDKPNSFQVCTPCVDWKQDSNGGVAGGMAEAREKGWVVAQPSLSDDAPQVNLGNACCRSPGICCINACCMFTGIPTWYSASGELNALHVVAAVSPHPALF